MANGWVKSMQCKSKAFDDVYHPIQNPKHLMRSYNCRKSTQSLKDVIHTKKPTKPKPKPRTGKRGPEPVPPSPLNWNPNRVPVLDPVSPSLTELAEGHPSRKVVEIIFQTSWGPKPFSGQVEVVFKVRNGSRTLTRFEEYREAVMARSKGREENARSVADGNETMRFYCLGPTFVGASGGAWGLLAGKGGGASVCTFSGSCTAHEKAGGGRGRRAILVCRVIAGRVAKRVGFGFDSVESARFDSVSGDDSELHVFDPRAVLPCFLIIYRL